MPRFGTRLWLAFGFLAMASLAQSPAVAPGGPGGHGPHLQIAVTAPTAVTAGDQGLQASVPEVPGETYTWSIINGTILSDPHQAAITFSAGSAGALHLLCAVQGDLGARGEGRQVVQVVHAPEITSFTASRHIITVGSSVTLTVAFRFGQGTLNPGIGSVTSGQVITVQPAQTTTYVLTVTNSLGKAVTVSQTVTVVPPPDATLTVPSAVTAGVPRFLASVPSVQGSTYAWTLSNGTFTSATNQNQVVFTPGTVGSLSLTCTVTNAAGDAATGKQTIPVIALPVLSSFTAVPSLVTRGTSVVLAGVFSGGAGKVDQGAGQIQSGQAISVTPLATTIYTLTVDNGAGGVLTRTTTVTVVPPPDPTITAAPIETQETAGELASVLDAPGTTFVWSLTGGTITAGQGTHQITYTLLTGTTATLQCVVTNAAGTSATGAAALQLVAPPNATLTAPSIVTSGTTGLAASVPDQPGCTFLWNLTGGTLTAGAGTHAITFTAEAPGALHLTCLVTNAAGTAATGVQDIQVVAAPLVQSFVASPTSINAGQASTLAFTFNGGIGSIDHGVGAVQSGVSVGVMPTMMTTYTLSVTNPAGAVATQSVTVTVNASAPGSVVLDTPNLVRLTLAGTYQFFAHIVGTGGGGHPPALRGMVTPATTAQPVVLWSVQESGGGTIDSYGFYTAPMTPGTYHVVATNSLDATKFAVATVLVIAPNPAISISVTPSSTGTVVGSPVTLVASIQGTSNQAVDWVLERRFGATLSPQGNQAVFQATVSGTYTILIASQADPSKSVEAFINVNDAGAPTIGAFTASLTSIPAGAATTLSWSVSGATTVTVDGLNVTGQTSESVKPLDSHDYLLVASNAQGASYAQVHVDVQAPTIQLFLADHTSVPIDGTVTLTPYFFNGQGQVDQGVGPVTSGVPFQVKPNGNTTYTLTVTNALGASAQAAVTVHVTVPGAIELGGPMAINSNYYDFQSAQLYDGRVLSFFGLSDQSNLYDPVHATSTIAAGVPAPTAPGGRRYPAFTVMTDGRLLLGGGFPNSYHLNSASDWELYDPTTNTFSGLAYGPTVERHTLVALLDGRVFLAGGIDEAVTWVPSTVVDYSAPSQSFIFDPRPTIGMSGGVVSNSSPWQAVPGDTGMMAWGPNQASLLPDGRVILSEGSTYSISSTSPGAWTNTHAVGLFDPAQNQISVIGHLGPEFYPSWPDFDASQGMSTLQFALPNGKVLFMGRASGSWHSWVFPAAIFDPATSQLTRLQGPRADVALYQPQVLPNGLIVFWGNYYGDYDADVYDPARNAFYSWAQLPDLTGWYQQQQSLVLQDGRIFWPGLSSYDSASGTYLPGTVRLFTYPFDLTITPWTATTNVGIPIQFKATTKDSGPVTWSAASGSIDAASGVFVAATPGICSITATDGQGHSAHAKVTVLPAPTMTVAPSQISLDPGGAFGFTAYLSNTSVQAINWRVVEGATGGTVTDQGLYMAPTTFGTYHLQAYSPIYPSATAVATITVAQPTGSVLGVQVSPSAATVLVGGNAAFKAVVTTTAGPSSNVTWQVYEGAAGGTVQAGALGYVRYQAPSTVGTYHLLAISNDNQSVMAMATVTIVSTDGSGSGSGTTTLPVPVNVTMDPHEASIVAGSHQAFAASVIGADDTSVTWKVDDGTGQAVSKFASVQDGIFQASQAGTYVVTATSKADSSASDFCTIKVSSILTQVNPTQTPIPSGLQGYSLTSLKNGRILIAGGQSNDGQGNVVVYGSAYVYDPTSKTFTATGSLIQPRAYHHAVLLDDGRVLITDGESVYACPGDPTGTLGKCSQYPLLLHEVPWAEIYDPASGTFQALPMNGRSPSEFQGPGLMNDSHRGGQILKMANGKAMVWGGWGDFMHSTYDTSGGFWSWIYSLTTIPDFFDPTTSLFALTSDQGIPNAPKGEPFTALANLPDGRVLIAGGLNPVVPLSGQTWGPPAADPSTLIFDPSTGTYTPGPPLATPRCDHTATTLGDGRILIVGGAVSFNGPGDLASFDPIPGHYWQDTPTTEIYDPTTGTLTPTGSLNESRAGHAAILLPNGKVMIFGGWHYTGNGQHSYPHTTEVYDPVTGVFSVLDHLAYGVDEPKLAMQGDGNIFAMGVVKDITSGTQSFNSFIPLVANVQSLTGTQSFTLQVDPYYYVRCVFKKYTPINLANIPGGKGFDYLRGGGRVDTPLSNIKVRIVDSSGNILKETFTNHYGVARFPLVDPSDPTRISLFLDPKYQTSKVQITSIYRLDDDASQAELGAVYNRAFSDTPGSNPYTDDQIYKYPFPFTGYQSTGSTFVNATIPDSTSLGRIDGAFNIAWVLSQAATILHSSDGSLDLNRLNVTWSPGNPSTGQSAFISSSYAPYRINVDGDRSANADDFDDGVLGHEFGHVIQRICGASGGSANGSHIWFQFNYDPTLAFSEGWGFFTQAVIKNASTLYPNNLKNPSFFNTINNNGEGWISPRFTIDPNNIAYIASTKGPWNEATIFRILWLVHNDPQLFNRDFSHSLNVLKAMANDEVPEYFSWLQHVQSELTNSGMSAGIPHLLSLVTSEGFPSTGEPTYEIPTSLAIGTPLPDQMLKISANSNRYQSTGYYRVSVPAGGTYNLNLTSIASSDTNQINFSLQVTEPGQFSPIIPANSTIPFSGSAIFSLTLPQAGTYIIRLSASDFASGGEPAQMPSVNFSLTLSN